MTDASHPADAAPGRTDGARQAPPGAPRGGVRGSTTYRPGPAGDGGPVLELSALTALSPLDGRYAGQTAELREWFSELALIRARVRVEAAWLVWLAREPGAAPEAPSGAVEHLEAAADRFTAADAAAVKALERTTRHDVKAVEYFLRERLARWPAFAARLHFACTSEDVNNLAWATLVRDAREAVVLPRVDALTSTLRSLARRYADAPMLARTHGQAASPTTMGKEIANVAARLARQRAQIADQPILAKMNGATGSYNAHRTACPDVDWPDVAGRFVRAQGLDWNPYTTQIEPHDWLAELLGAVARLNTVLIDFARDVWGYISLGYLRGAVAAGEIGSSTMPHKVNPIDFENAEGNLGLANAVLDHLARKLPVSRWQRDLTDSTVLRNLGVGFGHSLVGWKSIERGLARVTLDRAALDADLERHPEVLAEAVQTVMRRYGLPDAYEALRAMTQGKAVTADGLRAFIASLDLPDEEKARLSALRPADYTGLAARLAREI